MTRTYQKAKGRKQKSPPFVSIPHRIIEHPNYSKLTSHAVRLLNEFAYQYRGKNNGDLTAAFSILKHRGWRSPGTLCQSIRELKHFGFILITRQGGRHKATLYAVTWLGIDECGGKLDISPCRNPSNLWQVERDKPERKTNKKINSSSRYPYQCSRNMNQLKVVGGKK